MVKIRVMYWKEIPIQIQAKDKDNTNISISKNENLVSEKKINIDQKEDDSQKKITLDLVNSNWGNIIDNISEKSKKLSGCMNDILVKEVNSEIIVFCHLSS